MGHHHHRNPTWRGVQAARRRDPWSYPSNYARLMGGTPPPVPRPAPALTPEGRRIAYSRDIDRLLAEQVTHPRVTHRLPGDPEPPRAHEVVFGFLIFAVIVAFAIYANR